METELQLMVSNAGERVMCQNAGQNTPSVQLWEQSVGGAEGYFRTANWVGRTVKTHTAHRRGCF